MADDVGPAPTPLRHDPPACPVLIGREAELETLTSAVLEAERGHGSVQFLLGEAGVGKSRLAREVVDRVGSKAVTASGRAVSGTAQVPFRPLAEAVLRFSTSPVLDVAELRPFRAAFRRLLSDGEPTELVTDSGLVLLIGEGLCRLLRLASGGRLCLLLLEDLHWADSESLAVLDYLADRVRDERMVVLATVRSEETCAARAVLDRLVERRSARVIDVGRLDRQQTLRVARACLPDAELSSEIEQFVVDWSEGVPFLVEELLASLPADYLTGDRAGRAAPTDPTVVPRTFADSVAERRRRLSASERLVLDAAAVLGRSFSWTLVPAVTHLAEDTVVAALRRGVELQLLRASGSDIAFRHALTRAAVLNELLPPERATLARRALAALEATDPPLRGAHCELAADLAAQAGLIDRAAGLLVLAGRRAAARGALATAEITLRRADSLAVEDADLRIRIDDALTDVLAESGQTDRALDLGAQLLTALDRAGSSIVDRVDLHLRLARTGMAAGRWELAADHVTAARHQVAAVGGRQAPVVDTVAAQLALARGELDQATELASSALAGTGGPVSAETACAAWEVVGRVARQRELIEAERAFEQELALASAHDLAIWRLRALHELGTVDQLRTESVERLTATRELALQVGASALVATVDLQIAAGLLKQFRTDEGLTAARRATEASRRLHLATLPMARVYEATAFAQGGQVAAMEAALDDASTLAPNDLDVQGCAWGHCRATVSILTENRAHALEQLGRGAALLLRSRATVSPPFLGLHVLLLAVDGADEAARRNAASVRASEATRHHIVADLLDCADAVLLGRGGHAAEAAAGYAAADRSMPPLVSWYRQYARRLVAESALAEGWGEPVAWLREAAAFFADRGDRAVAAACRSLLRRAGAPVPRAGRGDSVVPPALRSLGVTSREADVLTLVGEGLTNAELASRLHLSPRTVEKHVASLLAKTGCRRRAELAAYVVRLTG